MTQPKTGSRFTPGPYEVVKLHDGGVGVAKRGMGTVIATFHDYVDSLERGEAAVNARFYKATPEMYELLDKLLNTVEKEDKHGATPLCYNCEQTLIKHLIKARQIKAAIDGEG